MSQLGKLALSKRDVYHRGLGCFELQCCNFLNCL